MKFWLDIYLGLSPDWLGLVDRRPVSRGGGSLWLKDCVNRGANEGHALSFNYTLAFALQLIKIVYLPVCLRHILTFLFLIRLNPPNDLFPSHVIKQGSVRHKNEQYPVVDYCNAQTRPRPAAHSCAGRAWHGINTALPGDLQRQSEV
jgi:hypothetical protein